LQHPIMSKDESIFSTASGCGSSGTQAQLVKVLANVVETQKSVASQFSALFERVEEARNETRRTVAALTDEIRRLEIRSDKMIEKVTTQLMSQNDALSAAHAAERAQLIAQNDNLLGLIKTTVSNNSARPAPVHPQPMQAYNQAMSANAMFGTAQNQEQLLVDHFSQMTPNQIATLQAQMRNLTMQQLQQQAMLAGARPAASSASIAAPIQMPAVPVAAIPTPATVIPTPVAAPPVSTAPLVIPQPAVVKTEIKPVVPAHAASTVEPVKPMFSFGSPAGSTMTANKPLFGGAGASLPPATSSSTPSFSFNAPKPPAKVEVKEEPVDEENDDEHVEEYEPNVEFAPVIPLPDMVETVTGEESETVILEDRCKLFRFTNGEWKERATGSVKVLKNEKTGKHRVVVRRDQVHKVAANFNIVSGVRIAQMKTSPKAVVWFCVDFSEDEVKGMNEQLSARFGSPQQAETFMDTVNEIADSLPKPDATPKKTELGAKVEIPKVEEKKVAAPAPAVVPDAAAPAWGDKFKMAAGEWDCSACYARNKTDVAECVCCGTANPNCEKKEGDKPANPFGKNASIFNPSASTAPKTTISFGFGGGSSASPATTTTPLAAPKTEPKKDTATPTASGFSFGSSSTTAAPAAPAVTAAPKFSFMQAAVAANKEDEKKTTFGSTSTPVASSNAFGAGVTPSSSAASFSFKTASASSSGTASPLPAFSFKTPDPSKPASIFGGSSKTLFGTSSPATPLDAKKVEEEKKETPGSVFGSSFMSAGSQALPAAGFGSLSGKPSIFDQTAKIEEGQKNFASLAKSKPFGQSAAVAEKKNEEDGDEEGEPEEYEPDVQFAPVIPLPDLVEVKTGEEDEKVLFTARSKIYRYVRETKEYKERGVGDLKLLHNEATNKFRVLMRRDQVHKLCANFAVVATSNLMEKAGQANARSIVVTDFAENEAGDVESLCIKFKNAEVAKGFQAAFDDAKARLV
ncbi:hypothetical protein PFISCL1PPCAC_23596, partial [Pristionchus fissidentatus]